MKKPTSQIKSGEEKALLVEMESIILDSGASNHMSNQKSWFRDLKQDKSKIRVWNDALLYTTGKGSIKVEFEEGPRTYDDVLYVL